MKFNIGEIDGAVQDAVIMAIVERAVNGEVGIGAVEKSIMCCSVSGAIAELFKAYEKADDEEAFAHAYLDSVLAICERCSGIYDALGDLSRSAAEKVNAAPLKVSELGDDLIADIAEAMGISIGEVHKHWDEYVVVVDGRLAFKEGK